MNTAAIKAWFDGLPPDRKRKVVVGGALTMVLLGILVAVMATDDGQKTVVQGRKKKVETSILTGRDPQKVGIEQLSAANKRYESQIENLTRQVQSIANGQGGQRGGAPGTTLPYPYANANGSGTGPEVVALPGAVQDPSVKGSNGAVASSGIAAVKAPDKIVQQAVTADPNAPVGPGGVVKGRNSQPPVAGNRSDLPPPNIPGVTRDNSDVFGGAPAAAGSDVTAGSAPEVPPPPPKVKLRVLTPRDTGGKEPTAEAAPTGNSIFTQGGQQQTGRATLASLARNSQREPEFYVPLGTILSGTLLTGVDAPASGSAAKKDPFPALFRIKHEAILPNSGSLDLRECFIVASAYGDLSSERVYMRAEGLSCQRGDGAVIEAALDAYLSGNDGKAGVRGTVVEKTGQLISRSLLAGFVGGIGKAFKPQQAQPVQLAVPGEQPVFQYPSADFVVGSGILGGGASAAERIATIYEDLARQIVPVIEVNAGISVDFIMTRGTTLRFKRVGEITGARANANANQRQQQGPRTGGQNQMNGQQGFPQNDIVNTSVAGSLGGGFSVTPGAGSSTSAPMPTGLPSTITGRR